MSINRLKQAVILQEYEVKMLSQWTEVESEMYTPSVLCMDMGSINLAINKLIQFIDKNVENVSNDEYLERKKLVKLSK